VVEDRSIPRSIALPHEYKTGQRNSSFSELNRARFSSAIGITARGIGRVKNVTSAAISLIAPCFRETMSRREHRKSGDYAFGTGDSIECKNRSANWEVTRFPFLVRGNFVYQYGSCEDNDELRFS
jgi:hypothetical protein